MHTIAKVFAASFGWIVAIWWGYLFLTGGGRSTASYAHVSMGESIPIPATSNDVIWSGWWPPTDGFRWNNSMRPDIAFLWMGGDRVDCGFRIAAFPFQTFQRLFWRLNSGKWNTDVKIDHDGTYELRGTTQLVRGTNMLTFRFPDATIAGNSDTRLLAIGLRHLSISCTRDKDQSHSEAIFADPN